MSATADSPTAVRYRTRFHIRILGSAAPVFPGFEVDILDRIPDEEKPDAVWHRERARAILRAHPEIKKLFGHSPSSAFFCLLCAGAQLGLAIGCAFLPWWGTLIAAWVFGAWLNVCLFQLAHECNHSLVFKKTSWNQALFTITSLPMFLSGHHTWWAEHLNHHSDLGAKKDFITRRRTFFLQSRLLSPMLVPFSLFMLTTQVLRSALGLLIYLTTDLLRGRLKPGRRTLAVLADQHLVSGYQKDRIELWAVIYPVLNFTMCGLLISFFGWLPILYLTLSQMFMTGFLHPPMLGIVLAISHFHGTRNYQPSASHYSWILNKLMFNAGLHVEHHDIAGIPWHRLWKLRRMAPEFYENLETITSYTALSLKFVFCSQGTFAREFDNETQRNIRRFIREAAEQTG